MMVKSNNKIITEWCNRHPERFWLRVNKREAHECWEWTGSVCSRKPHRAYGRIEYRKNNKTYHLLAHRLSYALNVRPIPEGFIICHTCDNPICVNPDHLILGTHRINVRDAINKGRRNDREGIDHRGSVLTAKQVADIRSSKLTGRALAKKHNVSPMTISRARNFHSYKNQTMEETS